MEAVKAGIANFRAFQLRGNTFFDSYEAETKERKRTDTRRSRIHFALLGGLITVIAGCVIALFTWVLNGHHIV